jgi:hypothetical protein
MKISKALKILGALALTAWVARKAVVSAAEWQRGDRMREMSNEGPLSRELPRILGESIAAEGPFVGELAKFAMKFPQEVARYIRAESM